MLVRRQLDRAFTDPFTGDSRITDARQSFGQVPLVRLFDCGSQLVERPRKDELPNEQLGSLLEEPCWRTVAVTLDDTAVDAPGEA